jgi:ATP-dependent Clp protease protease subunit
MARKLTDYFTFLETGIDIENRKIHLFGEIEEQAASTVIKGIQLMMAKDIDKTIDIYINTVGGCYYSSVATYDFIRACPTPIRTYAMGQCMSGGTLIFLAGSEKYMYENSVLMFHSVAAMAEGKVFSSLIPETNECLRIFKDMNTIYARHSNRSIREWNKLLKHDDVYIRTDDAKEYQLITAVIPSLKDENNNDDVNEKDD